MTQIKNPVIYFNDPTTSRAIFNGSAYFGLVDTDPTIASNQKLVRAVQENGSFVSLEQPVSINQGGNPVYNDLPVVLDIDGNYSYQLNDRLDAKIIYVPEVENVESGSDGFSGVIATENITLTATQTTCVLSQLGANESTFVYSSPVGDSRTLIPEIDYTITDSTTFELVSSKNAGDTIQARQWDPTGQLVPVNDDAESLLVFSDLAAAQASAVAENLIEGDTVTLNGNAVNGDGQGGDKYTVQLTAETNDDVNYLDLNGTLQLALQNNYYRFQNYSETTSEPTSSAGVLNINLDDGVVQTVTLSESISDIVFLNANPLSEHSSSVTLRVIQDGVGSWGVSWPAAIIWPEGTAPTVTADADAVDMYGFTTYDAGVTWYGFTLGQDFS